MGALFAHPVVGLLFFCSAEDGWSVAFDIAEMYPPPVARGYLAERPLAGSGHALIFRSDGTDASVRFN